MAAPGKNLVSEKEIFDYLMTKPGMDRIKAAGILANIAKESMYYSDAVEDGGEGIGLFQHTYKARKDAFLAEVPDWETNWRAQIDFAFNEGEFKSFMKQDYSSVTDSTRGFMKIFEKPQDQSEDEVKDRVDRLYRSKNVQEDIKELKVNMSPEESSIGVDKSKTKQEIEYEKLEGYREGKGIALRVYDNKTNRNIQVNAQWDVNTQSWSYSSPNKPEDMSDEELNKLGNYLVDPKMMWSKQGDAFYGSGSQDSYQPYTTKDGIETERFVVYDNPISNRLSIEQKEKIAQQQTEIKEKEYREFKDKEKDTEEKARESSLVDIQKRIKEARKAKRLGPSAYNKYLDRGGRPIEELEKEYEEKLIIFQKEQQDEELSDLVAYEKDLRRRKAEMENDPESFSESDIININKALDQVSFDIYDRTGNQDNTGPNGYTREDVENLEFEFKDEEITTTVIEPEDTVPEEAKVETPTELDEVVVDEDTPVSEDTTTKERSTIGDLAGLVSGLGGVSSIIAGVMGAKGFKDSMKKIDVRDYPELSTAFKEHLYQSQQLSKMGFTPEEERAVRDDIDMAYRTGIENMVRGTAGDRAKFLAGSGVLDANRSNALIKFAAEDAAVKRENQANHNALLQYQEEFNANKSIALRQEELAMQLQNKQAAGEFASSAFKYVMDGVDNARAMKGPYGKYIDYINNKMTGNESTSPLTSNIENIQ